MRKLAPLLLFVFLHIHTSISWSASLLNGGIKYFREENYPKAAEIFQKVCRDNPSSGIAHYYLAAAHFHTKNFFSSANSFQRSMMLDPSLDGPIARHYLAMSYYKLKLYRQAQLEFQKALDMDPRSKISANIHKHLKSISKILPATVPDDTLLWYYNEGLKHYRQKNFSLAKSYFREVYLTNKKFNQTEIMLASCCNYLGLYTRTLEILSKKTDVDSLYMSGFAAFHLGMYAKASVSLQKVWEEKKKLDAALYAGKSFARLGETEKAGKYLSIVTEKKPDFQATRDLELGISFHKKGKTKLAKSYLKKALEKAKSEKAKTEINRWLKLTQSNTSP